MRGLGGVSAPSNTPDNARIAHMHPDFLLLRKTSPQCGGPRLEAATAMPSGGCLDSSSLRSQGWEDAVVPVGCQTGGAERSLSRRSLQTGVAAAGLVGAPATAARQPGPAPPLPPHRLSPQEASQQGFLLKEQLV